MSSSSHDAYVPNYMMKQSLWNMEQQASTLRGMITPETKLMSWQPHLVSQAQRDMQHVYNSVAYSKHVHGGEGYGALGAAHYKPCPQFHVHRKRSRFLVGQAHRAVGKRRTALLRQAGIERRKAEIALGRCRSYHGMCGDGMYGGGCGTFLRIAVRDPVKKACLLEKDIAKHQECCERKCSWFSGKGNQANQCRKLAEKQAALAAIEMAEFGPQTYAQATDMQAQQYQAQIDQGNEQYKQEQAQTQRTLLIAGGGLGLALLAVMALR